MMGLHDRVIADLIDALDAIRRKATAGGPGCCAFISGAAQQAITNARTHQTRDEHGYFVVRANPDSTT